MSYLPLAQMPPAERREFLIFYARVSLRESRARRLGGDPSFAGTLLGWAQKARRQAATIRPQQGSLFQAQGRAA